MPLVLANAAAVASYLVCNYFQPYFLKNYCVIFRDLKIKEKINKDA
jgi:hypothetical protein